MCPLLGTELTATLQDPDGGIADLRWEWLRSVDGGGTYSPIATAANYTPAATGDRLRVVATYTDTQGSSKTAMHTVSHAVRYAIMEWTEDSSVDEDDVKVFYYALALDLLDGVNADTRMRVLNPLVPGANNNALIAVLTAVAATMAADVDAVDITGDGDVTPEDATVFYYALALPGSLGVLNLGRNGISGESAKLRREILGPFLAVDGAIVPDERLQEMLRKAHSLVR